MTLKGDSLVNVVSTDSILSYHLLAANVSIRYSNDAPIDILAIGEEEILGRTSMFPLDILLMRRNDSVYLFLMTPNNSRSAVPADLLYSIVEKNK
jgi:hypothetical protein